MAEQAAPERKKRKVEKAEPLLPWMRVPLQVTAGGGVPLAEVRGLDPLLAQQLQAEGFPELFPVQAAAWQLLAGGHSAAHDLCICAPTGSGKTLAYALPLLQSLARCAPRRLRALVVLPSRDLAAQVFGVLAALAPPLGLAVGLAGGQASPAAEAAMLHDEEGGGSGVDILVATPGRLTTHLKGLPGLDLAWLRFLVVDEADRLLGQAFQNWLPCVLAHTQAPQLAHIGDALGDPLAGASPRRTVKIVVSATLTRDPTKLGRLALHQPRYIALTAPGHRHAVPPGLKEFKLVCEAAQKPLALLALLTQLGPAQRVILIASTVDSTQRLHAFLAATEAFGDCAVEFSSRLSPGERAAALQAFAPAGSARILVASDAMTRGMDVADVDSVVSYEAPGFAKTYVHRAGRTARAGKPGQVVTMLRPEDVRHFKDLLRKVDNAYVRDYRLSKEVQEGLRPQCEAALARAAPGGAAAS